MREKKTRKSRHWNVWKSQNCQELVHIALTTMKYYVTLNQIIIRQPLLPRGTTTADFEHCLLFNNHRPCLQLFSHLLLSCLQAQNSVRFSLAGSGSPPKNHNFQACFQGRRNQKNYSERFQKTAQIELGIYKNDL